MPLSLGHHIVILCMVLVLGFELFRVSQSDVNICLLGSLGILMFVQKTSAPPVASGGVKISKLVLADKQKPGE